MVQRAHLAFTPEDATTGAVLTSASVNVYTPGTVTPIPATLFDKNGNVVSNPLTADSVTGLVDVYVAVAQEVDLLVSKAGYLTRTFSNVPFLDDASLMLTALLTTTGDIPVASAANSPARLAGGALNTVLHGGGAGVQPAYSGVAYADVIATAFTNWTPAFTQGGTNPTLTVQQATYIQIGKLVIVMVSVTATSGGSAGSNIVVSSLNIAPKYTSSYAALGSFTYRSVANAAVYSGTVVAVTSTNLQFFSNLGTGGAYLGNTNGPSFAVTNGDVLSFALVYEAA